ncbi:MAG: phosphodiester glycosidase family protein [Shimia sp.]|uniref:phosphodiester glycosidase family protein n=1 Tax=Shimia sp. TaxID=1954381 RepID=UPI0040593E24
MIRALLALSFALLPTLAAAVTCDDIDQDGNRYTVCSVDTQTEDLRLFLRDEAGAILGQFRDVAQSLNDGETLAFAMNAGMYHANRAPVGLYVQDTTQEARLLTGGSKGNFGLLPNGVFCIRDNRADVFETLAFDAAKPACTHASQSGPMLVINGALHPRFLPNSTSRFRRNGVGTTANGHTTYFVISNNAVTFHEFGSLFRDVLKTPNALYFDGKVSRLHASSINRSDVGFLLGPIVGVVE